ncbi:MULTISPECIES: GLPGLI family protein [Flavobacterium]|uniref:GLPGLI family protein n=1 Tax=Flavobacterium jumunjinense TaxID=998845 RepID=A0ABV5GKX5_9FLAO|nr:MULTISPECIES: GLPGLI family protein [Flavobacterium]
MKKTLIITLLFLNLVSFSQLGQIEYVASFKNKASDYINKELENIVDENASEIFYTLLVNGNQSIFFCENNLQKKSDKLNLLYINSKLIGTIYKDLEGKIQIQNKTVFGEEFTIKDSLLSYNWEIDDKETKLIDNMLCYKAINRQIIEKKIENEKNEIEVIKKEKNTIAWYCPSININAGPLGFYGLPGLILILEDDIFVYQAKKINFKLDKKTINKIKPPKANRFLTNKEFQLEYKKLKMERENMLKN